MQRCLPSWRHDQDAAVAAATVADDARSALLADLLGRVAECFPRRETRQCCGHYADTVVMPIRGCRYWPAGVPGLAVSA